MPVGNAIFDPNLTGEYGPVQIAASQQFVGNEFDWIKGAGTQKRGLSLVIIAIMLTMGVESKNYAVGLKDSSGNLFPILSKTASTDTSYFEIFKIGMPPGWTVYIATSGATSAMTATVLARSGKE